MKLLTKMKLLICVLAPFFLHAQHSPDRVTDLVETMRSLTFEGDLPAVGRLAPALINELATPHPKAAIAWNQIGVYHATQGNFVEAERAYKRGIQPLERTETGRGDLALLLLNLGKLYLQTDAHPGQAETLLRRALKLATAAYGPDSPALANFLYVLGAARQQLGDRAEARTHFDRALVLAGEDRDGKIRRGIILANLATLLWRDKQWIKARDSMLKAVSLLDENLGSGHPDLVPIYLNLAAFHRHFKQWELASASLERARAVTETRLGPEHPHMPGILDAQAQVLRKMGRRSDAKELSRRAKAIAALRPRDRAADSWVHVSDLK